MLAQSSQLLVFMLALKSKILPFEEKNMVCFFLITLGMTVNLLNASSASYWEGSFKTDLKLLS